MDTRHHASIDEKREAAVLGSRAKTGFGGIITITMVLLAMQLATGVQAFPL